MREFDLFGRWEPEGFDPIVWLAIYAFGIVCTVIALTS